MEGNDPPTSSGDSTKSITEEGPTKTRYDLRFWIIFTGLAVTSLLTAVESTVTSTALPTISLDLNAGEAYIWFVNAFFLSSTAFQPLYGQLANVFGRRWPLISAIAFFALGSGMSGGANGTAMLIAGRTIQGVGLGGVNMLIDIIVCDLVPLRERGGIMALIFVVFAVGSSIGPFIGGAFTQHVTWRWAFYISLPIAGLALAFIIPFLQVKYQKETTLSQKVKRIDWLGNTMLVTSVVAVLIALSFGGALYSWSSYRVIVPLILGLLGLVGFHAVQTTRLCPEPTMPPRLFANRTSLAAFIITFLHGMLTYWTIYFLPVYFQGVQGSSPTRSGVQLLPTVVFIVPSAIVAGGLITKFGRYKYLQIIGFAFMTLGMGLFTLLDEDSNTGEWTGFQLIAAIGNGMIITSTLPAAQAELSEADVASSTATWAFLRSFGSVWGAAIPAAIFNTRFSTLISTADLGNDAELAASLSGSNAYQQVSGDFVANLPDALQPVVVDAYKGALQLVWQVSIAFAGLGFLIAFMEKEVELRTTLDTEYGLKERKGEGKNGVKNTDEEAATPATEKGSEKPNSVNEKQVDTQV